MENIYVVGCFYKIFRCHDKVSFDRYAFLSDKKLSYVPVICNVIRRVSQIGGNKLSFQKICLFVVAIGIEYRVSLKRL